MTDSESQGRSTGSAGPNRRTVLKTAAWAAPVIATAAVVPTAAASLPPCVGSVTGAAQNSWSVGAQFSGCSQQSHFDVSILMTIVACEAERICIRVYDLGDESSGSGLRSRLWWNDIGDPAPPFLYIEKCFDVPSQGTTPVSFAVAGDQVRAEQSMLNTNYSVRGTITACCNTTNDGIHVNPCYFSGTGSVNRVAKFYYSLDGAPWTFGGNINAAQPQL